MAVEVKHRCSLIREACVGHFRLDKLSLFFASLPRLKLSLLQPLANTHLACKFSMIPTFFYLIQEGPPAWLKNNAWRITLTVLTISVLYLFKRFTAGATNRSERKLHGKVVLITGGTSGIGAETALALASRGAQIILLTHVPGSDPFLVDFIQDMREKTGNHLIYAEQVDLSNLHSIRKFATAWIDNAPPRRLDMIVLCAAAMAAPGGKRTETEEGIEETWMVNFLANFHLLGILSPAIRAQPFDRDVRIIMATCSSYIASNSLKDALDELSWSPGRAYARSKMALNVFAQAFQKHLDAYKRPDELPMTAKVILVDPGLCRTPGTRRWLTRGSLIGLIFYALGYLFPWFLLKPASQGAQSFLYAAMESNFSMIGGGKLVKECMVVDFARQEVMDEEIAKKLWEESDKLIEEKEKESARNRAVKRAQDDKQKEKDEEAERAAEVESLMSAIKKGKEREKQSEEKTKARKRNTKK